MTNITDYREERVAELRAEYKSLIPIAREWIKDPERLRRMAGQHYNENENVDDRLTRKSDFRMISASTEAMNRQEEIREKLKKLHAIDD